MAKHHQARVSIGIPVYNGEAYLAETLKSILGQTYSDFEVVISDNGSVDRTKEICEEFAVKDHRIRYFRNVENIGVAPNYNRVFELSSGEYFKWADYDDLIAPEFIEKCVEVLDNDSGVVVSCPSVKLIDQNGEIIENYDPKPDASSPKPHIRFRNLLLHHDHRMAQLSGLMRRSVLEQTVLHGSYPCSDEVLMANLGLFGYFHVLSERLFLIRLHPNQSFRGVLASERARVSFFDVSLEGKAVPIKWLYFKNCLHAINSAPLGLVQRAFCYAYMVQWLTRRQNFRSFVKDMLLLVHEHVPLFSRLYGETVAQTTEKHHYR
ncbi:MAG: glycosyltransferase family 2 protein [Caldilinea sp.]